ncbi:MAG: HEAT repeat domain-containing protein, partial [Planctomycetota bacterium]
EAAAALARFKDEYKKQARGLKGDDKLSQRDFAMGHLVQVQHPDVVAALAKIARSRDETLRILAVIYLGEERALPGLAGPEIVRVLKRGRKDETLLMSGLQSLGNLGYLGAEKEVAALLDHNDFAVKKSAIYAIGRIGDMRLWKEIAKLAGVKVKSGEDVEVGTDSKNNDDVVVEEGYSYDGVEVKVDTGTAGDGDQKEAERIGRAKLAANKRAAGAGAGAGRGGRARDPKELLPAVLETLYRLTGERFSSPRDVADWIRKNRKAIKARVKELEKLAKAQKAEAKAQKAGAKARKR